MFRQMLSSAAEAQTQEGKFTHSTGRAVTLLASIWDLFISPSGGLPLVDIPVACVVDCWAGVCPRLDPSTYLMTVWSTPGIDDMLECRMLCLLTLHIKACQVRSDLREYFLFCILLDDQ
jgi:hypothetical protein